MDYNTHASAWTPCQIGVVHYNMASRTRRLRNLLEPTWCTLDRTKNISIEQDIEWTSAKDMEGHIVIRDGGSLTVNCRVSMPKGGRIIIHPKGKLILNGATLNNDCDESWDGIELLSKGKNTGQVEMLNNSTITHAVNKVEIKVKDEES